MKGGRNVVWCGKSLWYQTLPFVMEYELGGDRAVIIVSALVAILSSSTSSVSKDNNGTEECLCRKAVTTAKWRDALERKRTVLFSDCGHIRG